MLMDFNNAHEYQAFFVCFGFEEVPAWDSEPSATFKYT